MSNYLPTKSDLKASCGLLGGCTAAGIVPGRWDRQLFSHFVHPLRERYRRRTIRKTAMRMRTILGPLDRSKNFYFEACGYHRMRSEQGWCHWRSRFGRDNQLVTRVRGIEHLRRCQREGRGVILWWMDFCGALIPKIALSREGVSITQLSFLSHGAPPPVSPFGIRFYGPFICAIENRYLGRRVYIPRGGSNRYLIELKKDLESGGSVWIAGERRAKIRNLTVPFLGRKKAFATGAPSLAWSTGASLLPVYTIRHGTFDYETVIDSPITLAGNEKRVSIAAAVEEFASRLGNYILDAPSNWVWNSYSVYELTSRESLQPRETPDSSHRTGLSGSP